MGGSGLDFGDASDDNVVFKADISSSFIPNNDDSFDLGSDSQRWKTAYLSNLNLSGSLYVMVDQSIYIQIHIFQHQLVRFYQHHWMLLMLVLI